MISTLLLVTLHFDFLFVREDSNNGESLFLLDFYDQIYDSLLTVRFRMLKVPFAVLGYAAIIISGIFGLARMCAMVLGYAGVVDTYRSFYQVK